MGAQSLCWFCHEAAQFTLQQIKIPALTELKNVPKFRLPPELKFPCAFEEIRVEHSGPVCCVYFDFYNGAMDQYQAGRLEQVLKNVAQQDCKIVVLMGGERFFSTGTTFNNGLLRFMEFL